MYKVRVYIGSKSLVDILRKLYCAVRKLLFKLPPSAESYRLFLDVRGQQSVLYRLLIIRPLCVCVYYEYRKIVPEKRKFQLREFRNIVVYNRCRLRL